MVRGQEGRRGRRRLRGRGRLERAGKHNEAEKAFQNAAAQAPAGYRVLSRFRDAAELAQTKPADAVKAFDAIADDPSVGATLQDLAAFRAGLLLVDTAPLSELERRLEPLTERTAPSVTARANCWRCRPGAPTISPPRAAGST